jgi:hypothetical protein
MCRDSPAAALAQKPAPPVGVPFFWLDRKPAWVLMVVGAVCQEL